jgi:TonB family protein
MQLCLGEEEAKRGVASSQGTAEGRRHFETAADYFRRASDLGTSEVRLKALTALAQTYDTQHLNDPARRETVLRELIVLVPTDPRFAFDLAVLQESQGFIDSAEETLLTVRQRHPSDVEAYKKLAQFYARRATTLQVTAREQQTPAEPPNPGEPDPDGVYQIGGQLPPPSRAGVPRFPDDAQAAGIQGAVQTEIVVDPNGAVADARIVKSIPLLDEAALKAVREWRFEPTIVNGRAVPVRMVVTVTFTLSK